MKVACELVPVLTINWRNYSKNVLFVGFKKRRILCVYRPCFASWLKKDVTYYMPNALVSPHGLKNDEYYVSSCFCFSCLQSVCKFDDRGSAGVALHWSGENSMQIRWRRFLSYRFLWPGILEWEGLKSLSPSHSIMLELYLDFMSKAMAWSWCVQGVFRSISFPYLWAYVYMNNVHNTFFVTTLIYNVVQHFLKHFKCVGIL